MPLPEPPHDPGRRSDAVAELLESARRGHDAAFGGLFECFRRHLLVVAQREIPDALRGKIGPSDLVQETAVDAQRAIPGFRGTTAEECFAWLRSILRHNVVDAVRHYETTQKRGGCREFSLATDAARIRADQVALTGKTPDGSVMRREDADRLAAVLRRLSADHRTVLQLRYWEALSFPEIGTRLGRSPDAVRKLWYRAVERLQEEMNGESSRDSSSLPAIAPCASARPSI